MKTFPVDLSSDTATRPTADMRRAMAAADVGDEQRREDPTTRRLEESVAALTGHESAVFLPSGTMCNLIAFAIHCRPGDEIIIEKDSHPVHFEGGGPAVHARATIRAVSGERGVFDADVVTAAIRPHDPHYPRSRLVSLENTHNMGGGTVWPLDRIRDVHDAARRHGLKLHLDGARLMNAVVATGTAGREICRYFDSVWIDLTKGLGCPVGAVLAGSTTFADQARRYKHLFGGAMRQSGMIAAAGVYALEHHVDRLAEDHARARRLADGLAGIPGIRLEATPETNIVVFDLADAGLSRADFFKRLAEHGVRMGPRLEATSVRAVTHLDIPAAGIDRALAAVSQALKQS
ncbi:MAG: GntG family PLP-dependent aldolase [Phycisphaerae bacterium]